MLRELYNLYFKLASRGYKRRDIKTLDMDRVSTILVISNTALGDTILSTPAIKSLKKSFPDKRVVAILNSTYSPLFRDFEYIDRVIEYNGNRRGFLKAVREVKREGVELALILHSNGPYDIWLTTLGGAKYILKHPTKSKLKRYLSHIFEKKEQHTIEDRLDLVRILGGKVIDRELEIGKLNNQSLSKKFREFKGYIGLQIGAADRYKIWPIERFIELAKRLYKDGEKILITGTKEEWKMAQKIKEVTPSVVNMCGKTSIEELPYLVRELKMLITNDTGTMHLAIALKVPTLSLFSPTSATGIGPYQDMKIHRVIQKDGSFIQRLPKKERDDSAMRLISLDEVYSLYKELR
jgi:ADP-heptose:LPS heptosyltransferase